MNKAPKHSIGTLLGLSALLTGILAWEMLAGLPFLTPEAPAPSTDVKKPAVIASEAPPEKPAISTFAEVVNRPLFTPSRRPTPPKADTNVAAPKAETFDLIGVIISPGSRMALLRTLATSEVMRAVEGQNVGGWEVRSIKPTQVVLQRGGDSEVLKITDAVIPQPNVAPSHNSATPANPNQSGSPATTAPIPDGSPETSE
jgi:general secretion pathway protein N